MRLYVKEYRQGAVSRQGQQKSSQVRRKRNPPSPRRSVIELSCLDELSKDECCCGDLGDVWLDHFKKQLDDIVVLDEKESPIRKVAKNQCGAGAYPQPKACPLISILCDEGCSITLLEPASTGQNTLTNPVSYTLALKWVCWSCRGQQERPHKQTENASQVENATLSLHRLAMDLHSAVLSPKALS